MIERKVTSMISSPSARAAGAEVLQRAMLPLVRLRVDYTGFSTINAQRFGQKFVGRVANPHDMLLFHKAAARKAKVRCSHPLIKRLYVCRSHAKPSQTGFMQKSSS